MVFNNIEDIKSFINKVSNSVEVSNEYYDDLKWFCNVNYTTTTEYFGELRIFIKKILDTPGFSNFNLELRQLLETLDHVFHN